MSTTDAAPCCFNRAATLRHSSASSSFAARIDWMHAIGFQPDPGGEGMVIVNAFCNFYRQIEYPGDVLLKMYVSDPGRTTFESWATMARRDAPDVICAAGGATTIWVDFPKQKAKDLPAWLREIVSAQA